MSPELARIVGETNFTVFDWVIVGVYLALSIVIGLMVKKYVTNMADFIGAGRAVGQWLGIATMTGTEMGLVTVMYSAQKGFTGGFAAFHIALAAGVVAFFVGLTGFIVFRLRETGVLTIPEYYERRFGRRVRVLGGIMLVFGGVLNMGLFLKVGSMFIVGITGMSAEGWALPAVMTTLLTLVLIYTVLGGMISVIITDYIQFVVLSIGLLVATALVILDLGWDRIFSVVAEHQGEAGFNPLVAEGTFGAEYVVWMVFLGLVNCALWPTAIARALAMESPQAVKRQYMWSSISFLIRNMIPYFWGIGAFVFVMTKAPELRDLFFPEEGEAALSNLYAMPIYLGKLLPPIVIGVISAAMIAAFMSTHDSYLLVWASVITQDIVDPLRRNPLSTGARILLTRVLIVVLGLYILYWGLFYEGREDIWDYMAVTGAIYFTGAFALLVGGLYWSRASSTGAFLALLCGCTAILGLTPIQDLLNLQALPFEVTGARMGLFTVGLTTVVMILGSLIFPDRERIEEGDRP